MTQNLYHLADVYGAQTYNSQAYSDAGTTAPGTTNPGTGTGTTTPGTSTGTATPTPTSNGGILANTGFDILVGATVAAMIVTTTLVIRFWKRPATVKVTNPNV